MWIIAPGRRLYLDPPSTARRKKLKKQQGEPNSILPTTTRTLFAMASWFSLVVSYIYTANRPDMKTLIKTIFFFFRLYLFVRIDFNLNRFIIFSKPKLIYIHSEDMTNTL